MKTTLKLLEVDLLEKKDYSILPVNVLDNHFGRLIKNEKYLVVGFARIRGYVDKNGNEIKERFGILLERVALGTQIVVGLNYFLGVGFLRNTNGTFDPVFVSKQLFTSNMEVESFFGRIVRVVDVEKLTIQKWESDETLTKDFPILEIA